MRDGERGSAARLVGRDLRIGIVQARFNATLTDRMAAACIAELESLGVVAADITHVQVPGALEIGVALNALAEHVPRGLLGSLRGDDDEALVVVERLQPAAQVRRAVLVRRFQASARK